MRKTFLFTIITVIVAVFHACDNVEFSTDGNLYGYWHLVAVDTLGTQQTSDMSRQRIFWSVESRLVGMCDRDGVHPEIICEFERVGDTLVFHNPYYSNRNEGDILIDDVQVLAPYGLSSMQPKLYVEKLSSGKLILLTPQLRLKFKKL